jgi:hypothetical protein
MLDHPVGVFRDGLFPQLADHVLRGGVIPLVKQLEHAFTCRLEERVHPLIFLRVDLVGGAFRELVG